MSDPYGLDEDIFGYKEPPVEEEDDYEEIMNRPLEGEEGGLEERRGDCQYLADEIPY